MFTLIVVVIVFVVPSVALTLDQSEGGVVAGGSTSTIAVVTGSPQSVTMSVSNLPSGVIGTFANNPITESGTPSIATDLLTLSSSSSTAAGTYQLLVTATGADGETASTYYNLIVSSSGYVVTFSESGLASGTAWSLAFDGVQYSSTSDTLVISNVPPGPNQWNATVLSPQGALYVPYPNAGTADVSSSGTIPLTYFPWYKVTFSATGLDSSAEAPPFLVRGQFEVPPLSATPLPRSFFVSAGITLEFNYSNIIPSTNAGQRFSLLQVSGNTSDDSVLVDAPTVVTGQYVTQYQVSLEASPPSGGTTNPPSGSQQWYDAGSTVGCVEVVVVEVVVD